MSTALTPLGTSILALAGRKSFIEPALGAIKRYRHDADLLWTVGNYLLVQVHAFYEEWRRFQALAGSNPDILITTRVAKPAIDRIKAWPGVSKVRNSIIAHTRLSDGSLLLPNATTFAGVPTNYAEQMLLAECALLAISTVMVRHSADFEIALGQISGQMRNVPTGIDDNIEFRRDLLDIRSQIFASDPSLEGEFGEFNPGI